MRTKQHGLTLVELVLALLISSSLYVLAISMFSDASASQRVTSLAANIGVTIQNVRANFRYSNTLPERYRGLSADADGDGNTTDGDVLVKAHLAPAPLRRENGTDLFLQTEFGSPITVGSANVGGVNGDGFFLAWEEEQKGCGKLGVELETVVDVIEVAGRVVKTRGATLDRTNLATACGTNGETVSFRIEVM